MVYALDTAAENFNIMLQVGAGTGLLYLLRWYWWRITAWCEVAAMVASFGISVVFLILSKNGMGIGTVQQLLVTIAFTTVCWVLTAYFGPQTDVNVLIDFYKKVRPFGPGWRVIRLKAGIPASEAALDAEGQNFPLALLGWFTGCIMIWSALFTVGNFLYGRMEMALGLLAVFVVTAIMLIRV